MTTPQTPQQDGYKLEIEPGHVIESLQAQIGSMAGHVAQLQATIRKLVELNTDQASMIDMLKDPESIPEGPPLAADPASANGKEHSNAHN